MEIVRFIERFRTLPEAGINLGKSGLSKLFKKATARNKVYPIKKTKRKSKRSKKIKGNRVLVLLIAMVFSLASLIILIVLLPASLLSMWMACSLNYTHIRRVKVRGTVLDFWLNEKQAKNYLSIAVPYHKALERMRAAYDQGAAMGLTKRKNQLFDEGSQLGKELNSVIESNQKTVRQYRRDVELVEKEPLSKWAVFRKAYVDSRSYGAGFVTWLAAVVLSIYLFSGDFASGFKTFFLFPFLALEDLPGMLQGFLDFQLRFGRLTMDDWTMVLVPTLACYSGYFLTALLIRNRAARISPEPPVVTVENALKYVRDPKRRSIRPRPATRPRHAPKAS